MIYSNSRDSLLSYTGSFQNLTRLLDFTASTIPGLFKSSSNRFILDYKEEDLTVNISFRTRNLMLQADLCETILVQYGIEYNTHIKITHENGEEYLILIPDIRGYNPAVIEKPYITTKEYSFIVKFISIEIRAACMGVFEEKIDYIKEKIQSISKMYPKVNEIIEWVHIQIKCACYKKSAAPKFYEILIASTVARCIFISDNNHCKEYLENCISGEEVFLPDIYYQSVLDNEPKISFKTKIKYTEILNRDKRKTGSRAILRYLPEMLNGLLYVKKGKTYLKLFNDMNKYAQSYKSTQETNPCKIM